MTSLIDEPRMAWEDDESETTPEPVTVIGCVVAFVLIVVAWGIAKFKL